MKIIYSFIVMFLASGILFGQCSNATFIKTMDTPRASIVHTSGSAYWWEGDQFGSTLTDANLSSQPAVLQMAAGLWYAAKDVNGELYIRDTQYGWVKMSKDHGNIKNS